MKVTKTQLRHIIREERRNLLNEIKDGQYTVNGEPFSDLADAKEEADAGGFEVIDTSTEEVVYSSKKLAEIEMSCPMIDTAVPAWGDGPGEEIFEHVIREVVYANEGDPVGTFESELMNAWDTAVGMGAVESELAMVVDQFLDLRGIG